MNFEAEVRAARERIHGRVRQTPVQRAATFESDNEVWLKLENTQLTGSFKLRGVMNKLLSLDEETRARGFLASSTGNHGAAAAYAARELRCPGTLVVPTTARASKVSGIRAYGAEVLEHGEDCVEAEVYARQLAEERGLTYISPYNDVAVAAGQGTAGLELCEQVQGLDAVFLSVGGGGLLSGFGGALAQCSPQTELVGVSPENSPVMQRSLEAGEILELESSPTLSDATAGGLESGSVTFELASEYASRIELVSEEEIRVATRRTILDEHTLVEGAAGCAVAGYWRERARWQGKRVAILLCGANIGEAELKEVL